MATAAPLKQIVSSERPFERPPDVAGAVASVPQQLLAMQRAAGNAATARLVGGDRRRLDRCGCGGNGHSPCRCGGGLEEVDEERRRVGAAGAAALQRAVLSRRATAYRSQPS